MLPGSAPECLLPPCCAGELFDTLVSEGTLSEECAKVLEALLSALPSTCSSSPILYPPPPPRGVWHGPCTHRSVDCVLSAASRCVCVRGVTQVIIWQALDAVKYLHSLQVVHRDIKVCVLSVNPQCVDPLAQRLHPAPFIHPGSHTHTRMDASCRCASRLRVCCGVRSPRTFCCSSAAPQRRGCPSITAWTPVCSACVASGP